VLNGVLIGIDGPWLVFAVMSAASVISVLVTVHLPLREVERGRTRGRSRAVDRRRPRGVRPAPT
jgi:uncharacterized membrane protein